MKNELTVIASQTVLNKEFTVYGTLENPLFLAKDVAEWIEHSNLTSMINSVDDDEKLVTRTKDCLGRDNTATFLTESGLYEVLMLSRKPIAKQFKKEVKKVLHQIRMTGGYTVPRTYAEALRLAAEQQEKIELLQPKADVYDKFIDNDATFNFQETAKQLGFSTATVVINYLAKQGYCYRQESKVLATDLGLQEGILKELDFQSKRSNYSGVQTRLTIKGQEYLLSRIAEIKEFAEVSRGA